MKTFFPETLEGLAVGRQLIILETSCTIAGYLNIVFHTLGCFNSPSRSALAESLLKA